VTAGNAKAAWALITALLAFGVFVGAGVAANYYDEVRLEDALVAVPAALVLSVVSVLLGRRARRDYHRSLGRRGSRGFIALSRFVGMLALLVAITAALALAVFAVLVLAYD
jgi:nitrogen fixation/metabolism regulation signal transduction histidine kinase